MKVLVFPKDENPYQELLYTQIIKEGVEVKYLKLLTNSHTIGMMLLPLQLFYYRLNGYTVFHLHWLYDFSSSINNPLIKILSKLFYSIYFVKVILLIRLLGYKLVWTVHNLFPHESLFLSDLLLTKFLLRTSHINIVHTIKVKTDLESLGIKAEHISVIPHGSYVGYYQNTISRSYARELLKIHENDFIILFFGQLRAYKGIPELLESFNNVAQKNENLKLMLVGSCSDNNLLNVIRNYKTKLGNQLILHLGKIPDEEIQNYMNSSDIVVLPFKKITTSGSMMLALSFGKPVIYPNKYFQELPRNIGYDYEHITQLYLLIEKASKDTELLLKGNNALKYANEFEWSKLAKNTLAIYRSL